MSADSIEFRFPGGRWEPIPPGYTRAEAVRLFKDYDLRINGDVVTAGNDQPWEIYDRPNGVRVVPMQGTDGITHELDDDCVCGPDVNFTSGRPLVVHHSLDGREHEEDHS